jgi:hypothetical protein
MVNNDLLRSQVFKGIKDPAWADLAVERRSAFYTKGWSLRFPLSRARDQVQGVRGQSLSDSQSQQQRGAGGLHLGSVVQVVIPGHKSLIDGSEVCQKRASVGLERPRG